MTSNASTDKTENEQRFITELQAVLGADQLLLQSQISEKYLQDWSGEKGFQPLAVIRPRSTEEVSKALALCHQYKYPVVPQGGMTGLAGGANAIANSIVLSLERMSGITEIDAGSATMTAWSGTPLQVMQEAAEQAGFIFALDLGARGSCQIGGNLSTNAGGNRVIRYGMARDVVLGLEVVQADGTVLSMMNKMAKNNAAFDLKHLFIGSEGTLGIITQVVVKLHPKVTGANTALVALDSFDSVIKLLRYSQQALSGLVSAFEVMWHDYYQSATTVGGIRAPIAGEHPLYVLIDMQSASPEQDRERFEAVLEHALENGWLTDAVIAQSHADAESFWLLRDSVAELLQSFSPTINFDISFPISRIGEAVERLNAVLDTDHPGIKSMFFGHVGDGNIHVVVGPLPEDDGKTEYAIEKAFYDITAEFSGSVSAEHGIGLHKKPWLHYSRTPAELALMRTLKQALDPKNILNPGKVFDLTN
ncbi:FAD-binding oxidoreductase [uncultured Paenalcaligenes sp.]|uniref:FAD-binding oxidoreductase n=1 Tax=uncultured Paenalcaligenes sp. TaxID=1588925 RepID=UPI0026134164|nr:FAD-binding oxidoreductase [uncultured Paenalcaligenes sp.]